MTKSCDSKKNKKSPCKGSKCETNKNISTKKQEQTKSLR